MSAALHFASYRWRRNRIFGENADFGRRHPARARKRRNGERGVVWMSVAWLDFAVLRFPDLPAPDGGGKKRRAAA